MITDFDRTLRFGASDTKMIMRSWDTKNFNDWWLMKVGLLEHNNFSNIYTEAGNAFEVPILESLGIDGMVYGKRAVWGECERLVVNLDGNDKDTIYEVKSVMFDRALDYPRKVPLDYWRQVQVQMLVTGFRKAFVVAYGLLPEDYKNPWPIAEDIEPGRLFMVPVEYDEKFIAEYIPRLSHLAKCLESGKQPRLEDVADAGI